jgi:tetratricopeptide (TPR) repeat protein
VVTALFFFLAATSFDTAFRDGLIALQRNDLSAAKTSLESAAGIEPRNGKVWVALAQTYRKLNDNEQAEAAATKASVLAAGDPLILQSLAIYYSESGQPIKAIRCNPAVESYYFDAANALLRKERFADAIDVLQAGRVRFAKSAQIHLALGVSYYGLRRFDQAASEFLTTIALAPDVEQPFIFLGKMLDQIPERLPDVTRRFIEFETANPSNYAGYYLHARALDAQSADPELAEKLLRKALTLNDQNPAVHFELATLLEKSRRYPDAAVEFERAIALDASDAATHYRLSRVYERLGRHDAASAEREIHAKLVAAQDAAQNGMQGVAK